MGGPEDDQERDPATLRRRAALARRCVQMLGANDPSVEALFALAERLEAEAARIEQVSGSA